MKAKLTISWLFFLVAFVTVFSCKKGTEVANGYDKEKLDESITVAVNDARPDYSMIAQARLFPGLVSEEQPRLNDKRVTFDFNYIDEQYNRLRISVLPEPQFSTGLYVAPGETLIIDVPADAKGLTCQIGAWTDNLSGKQNPKRYPLVYSRMPLNVGRNYMRNLFGGNVYIRTSFPISTPVTLSFSNVCEAPDFYLGKTDPVAWKQAIKTSKVPWFEFGSKYVIFTLPRDKMVNYLRLNPDFDPSASLSGWNDIILKDYYDWQGLSDTASHPLDKPVDLPWRVVLDDDISVGYGHNGYPVMAINDNAWFGAALKGHEPTSLWGVLHEIGHNNQQPSVWSWGALGETTCNLFSFSRAIRMGIPIGTLHSDGWFAEGIQFVNSSTGNFDDLNPFQKIVPFLQIYYKTQRWDGLDDGWGFMKYLYRRARHARRVSLTDIDKKDFFYEALCEYTGYDCYKFFKAWKIPISAYSRSLMASKYPNKLKYDIWNYNPLTRQGGNNVVSYALSKSDWTVVDFDSEERTGEGANNGRAIHAIDNNVNTFWHSQWQGATPPYPHHLTIDMGDVYTLNGIYITARQNTSSNTRPKGVEIWVGTTPTDLTKVNTTVTELANVTSQQEIQFPAPTRCRFFKVVFTSGYGPTFAAVGDINVF